MKNPFKKKPQDAAPDPRGPEDFACVLNGELTTYNNAIRIARDRVAVEHYWGSIHTPPAEAVVYRLIPVAVVKRQPPSVELIPPTT